MWVGIVQENKPNYFKLITIKLWNRGWFNPVVIFFLGLIFSSLTFGNVPVTHIKGLRIWPSPENTRLVFDLDGPIRYQEVKSGSMEKNQVILDLKHAKITTDFSKLKLAKTRIKNIKSIPQKNDQTRIIIELEKPLKPNCFTLTPNQQYGHRLVIDLEMRLAEDVDVLPAVNTDIHNIPNSEKADILAMFADGSDSSNIPLGNDKVRSAIKNKTANPIATHKQPLSNFPAPATNMTNNGVSHPVKTLAPRNQPFVVAIDAGHGGEDPGAIGCHGTREKDVVLAIARYLKAMVDKEPGMQAVLIRSGDYYVGLQDRVLRARKRKADLFISLHADAFQDKRAAGASVFTLSERGASSAAARWLAERENRSDLIGGVRLHASNKVLASVLLDLSQSASKEEGLKAARYVLKSLGGTAILHRGCVEQAGFAVLKAPDIPSMLVETGFISHPLTERKLKTSEYQKKIACAIMVGIRHYAGKKIH